MASSGESGVYDSAWALLQTAGALMNCADAVALYGKPLPDYWRAMCDALPGQAQNVIAQFEQYTARPTEDD